MERTMSVEEKIKRAEEIYARRHEHETRNTVYLNGKEKKDLKIFKKMIIQMIICFLIYVAFYTIRNNNYIFSEDFLKRANELLSNDTNFSEIYQNISEAIEQFFTRKEERNEEEKVEENNKEEDEPIQNIGGNNEQEEIIRGGTRSKSTFRRGRANIKN